jgi:imidazolonepropionase-like amidohydrolase
LLLKPESGVSLMTAEPRLLIENGALIDGSGAAPVENVAIVVEGNRIARVGSAMSARPDDMVIDATGKYILPGLIDAHCHLSLHQGALPGVKYTSSAEFCALWAARVLGKILNAGVTGIAVPGGKWFADVIVRDAIAGGMLEGPRMVVAARALGNYGGIFDADAYPGFDGDPADAAGVLCNTPEAFVLETRKQCRRGVDRAFSTGAAPLPSMRPGRMYLPVASMTVSSGRADIADPTLAMRLPSTT